MLDINNVRKDKPSSFFKFHTIHSALEPWNKALAHWTMTTMMSLKFIKSREKKSQVGCQEVATFGATNVDVVCCFKIDFTERNTTFVKVFFFYCRSTWAVLPQLNLGVIQWSRVLNSWMLKILLDSENVFQHNLSQSNRTASTREIDSRRGKIYICEKKNTE